jgi:acyl transferase domain-containing protein/NAD(P)-dependent dehydrogenase (short-subunit alcohol dehydrogenase family)/acyl carrier protein
MKQQERVAIVGIGCRYPGGVRGPNAFFDFLMKHGDGIRSVPADRWDVNRFSAAERNVSGRGYVEQGGFLDENVFEFDPIPFGISPREAEYLDPQQRLLLEATMDALDDAGYESADLRGSNTGVYVGAFNLDMRDMVSLPRNASLMSAHSATGASHTVISNRLSYTFDWHGPSFTVDTACSSSLVTTHYACRDLLDGRVNLALAGGVNVMLSPVSTNIMCKGQFLAADGRSKAFDARADGYGRGEGVGLVVLKRLSDALRDRDRIYAVILGSGVNQDGKTDGLPMPNGKAQADLCRQVVREAGIDPARLGYVEAHGTGTRAGDPIETRALAEVYSDAARGQPLAIGSVKTNIGHLEAAAGVTGLIKAALCLHRDTLLPLRALGDVNPELRLEEWKLRIPLQAEPWPTGLDKTAAVNSFGYGGTNAHAIVGAVEQTTPQSERPSQEETTEFLPLRAALLTAYDQDALRATARGVSESVDPAMELRALSLFRNTLPQRAFVFGHGEVLMEALGALAQGRPHEHLMTGAKISERPRVLWVFTGMGPQWWAMGRELFALSPVFRATAERVDEIFVRHSGWSILEHMLREETSSEMATNRIAQPANFVLQIALVELLRHHQAAADGYLGHSVGELAAAWASGALDLETATALAFHRSDIQQQAAGQGTMAALEVGLEEGEAFCRELGNLSVAAVNGDESIALAGGRAELESVVQRVAASGRFARLMQVEVAYHSHHMAPLRDAFFERLQGLTGTSPQAPLYSTARGLRVEASCHDPQYWWENARNPVLLAQTLECALGDGYDVCLEIGPHPVLAQALAAAATRTGKPLFLAHTQRRGRPADTSFSQCLGSLVCVGVPLELGELLGRGPAAALPLYPFQRRHYWFEPAVHTEYRLGRKASHPLLDQPWDTSEYGFSTVLAGRRLGWVKDHQVQGVTVFPGAGYIEAALALCQELGGDRGTQVVEGLRFDNPLLIDEDTPPALEVSLHEGKLSIHSRKGEQKLLHAVGRVSGRSIYRVPPPEEWEATAWAAADVDELYESFARRGLLYGPRFRLIEQLWTHGSKVKALISVPAEGDDYLCFPGTLDAAFQALLALLPDSISGAVVPVSARSVRCFAQVRGRVRMSGSAWMKGEDLVAELRLDSDTGEPLLVVERLICRPVNRATEQTADDAWFHEKCWVPLSQLEASSSSASAPSPRGRAVVVVDPERHGSLVGALVAEGRTVVESLQELGNVSAQVVFPVDRSCSIDAAEELVALHLLGLALSTRAGGQLILACSSAYRVRREDDVHPGQAALVGMARVFMTEYPGLDVRVIDADPDRDSPALAEFISSSWEEEEVALREGVPLALRIERNRTARELRLAEERAPYKDEAYELFVEKPGRMESLCYRPRHLDGPLGDDEVEVDVAAASLNFKDVMKVLGMLDDVALERTYLGAGLGLDAAGTVRAVGKNVTRFTPGNSIFAFAPGALGNRLRVDQRYAVRTARNHTAIVASTYGVYQTVWLGLRKRAQLARGEKILIHSAAGAVGLCAIQLAKECGAEIYATAGTDEKRDYLRGLGVTHVYDSRTLDFSAELLRDTGGRGVDVLLNSLAGEAFLHNFDLLAAGGRLVELGKKDFAQNRALPLRAFNRAISLIAVDMDRMALESPDYYLPIAEDVLPAERAVEAFRRLASGKQVGKLVIDFSEPVSRLRPGLSASPLFRKDSTYLVTGGLGGFGLESAKFLLRKGAGQVVLASRRGKPDEHAARALEAVSRETGGDVRFVSLDVTEQSAVWELVAELGSQPRPLRGLIHSAMILDDAPLADMTLESLARVMNAKALGAWHLHEATKEQPLDYFVLYSSVSAMAGNPGQAAYAAANSFLDGLAEHRSRRGLAATAIQWGAIADVGVLSREAQVETHLRSIGLIPLDPTRALAGLEEALRERAVQRGIIDIDWDRWVRTNPETRWNRLTLVRGSGGGEDGAQARLLALLQQSATPDEVVLTELFAAIAPIFKMVPEELDADRPLKDFGLDSLMALEVQVAIEDSTGVEISTMELLAGRSLRNIAQSVLGRLAPAGVEGSARAAVEGATQVAERQRRPVPPLELRRYVLDRICVQPPYFSLENLQAPESSDLLGVWQAEASPVPPCPGEAGVLSLAEAARHATILASCAARECLDLDGRVYFPVREAEMLRFSKIEGEPLGRIIVRAKCLELDKKGSSATCEAIALDLDGNEICAFRVRLHVIPAAEFETLFASEYRENCVTSGEDPYSTWMPLPSASRELVLTGTKAAKAKYVVRRGPVEAIWCLGHFNGYPAYPVSIMARDAVSLVTEGLRLETGVEWLVRVIGGRCTTTRFAFEGQELTLEAEQLEADAEQQQWRVHLLASGESCAQFDMKLLAQQAPGRTVSLVVGPPDELEEVG